MLKPLFALIIIVLIIFLVYYSSCETRREGYDGQYTTNGVTGTMDPSATILPSSTPTPVMTTIPSVTTTPVKTTTPVGTTTPAPTTTTSTPTPTTGTRSGGSGDPLSIIQNFIVARADFVDAINQLIVYLSTKGTGYQTLIQNLHTVQTKINGL